MDATKTRQHWKSRGFSFGIFRDPSGRIWPDFSHSTDELVILAEGQIEIEVAGVIHRPVIGEEILSPHRLSILSVISEPFRNYGQYGYRVA